MYQYIFIYILSLYALMIDGWIDFSRMTHLFQEDKEKLFDVVDTIKGVLSVANGTLSTLKVTFIYLVMNSCTIRKDCYR